MRPNLVVAKNCNCFFVVLFQKYVHFEKQWCCFHAVSGLIGRRQRTLDKLRYGLISDKLSFRTFITVVICSMISESCTGVKSMSFVQSS